MGIWTVISAIIVGVLGIIYFYHRRKMNYFRNLGIPYIPPRLIFGNLSLVVRRKIHINYLLKQIYNLNPEAKYVGAFHFLRPIFVIRDPELIESIAMKNFDFFPDHRTFFSISSDPFFKSNLAALRGEAWREVRNLLSPAFTLDNVRLMFDLMSKRAEEFASTLAEQSLDHEEAIADTKDVFTRYVNDIIATCAFGTEVDSLKKLKNEFYLRGKEAMSLEGSIFFRLNLAKYFPKLVNLLKLRILPKRVTNYFTKVVSDAVETRRKEGIARPDMIQLMMDAKVKENGKLHINAEQMAAQAFAFFFGGYDNSSTFMAFLAHEIACNIEVQSKLQEEIDLVMDLTDGHPSYEAIEIMQYLDAVVNETLRLHYLAPMLERLCVKQFKLPPALPGLEPVIVEPGTAIWIPVAGIHDDPQYYENPEKFDPDRFFNKKSSANQTTFLSFGIGPRMCIGKEFALLKTKILFFHLLAKCDLRLCKKTNPLILETKTCNASVKGGFWLEFEDRFSEKRTKVIEDPFPTKLTLMKLKERIDKECSEHGV